ncbi:hypothetical protein KAJ27_02500 [bacterium]|nr:hypothetical protein [bacterium]
MLTSILIALFFILSIIITMTVPLGLLSLEIKKINGSFGSLIEEIKIISLKMNNN